MPVKLHHNIIIGFALLLASACSEPAITPKPRSYPRIDLPEKQYQHYDSLCPFSFDYPNYAKVLSDPDKNAEPCWLNIEYQRFKATLHLSYKPVQNNIRNYIEDSRTLASKHMVKSTGIEEQLILRDSAKVYGLLYNIEGNTASALQFYLTDSSRHFIRGSLYFNAAPNIDSVAPVLNFLQKDVQRMIQSFGWKD